MKINTVPFSAINAGDTFHYNGFDWIKAIDGTGATSAVHLTDGVSSNIAADIQVTPVTFMPLVYA